MAEITREDKASLDAAFESMRIHPNERAPAISSGAQGDKAMAGTYLTSDDTTKPKECQEIFEINTP